MTPAGERTCQAMARWLVDVVRLFPKPARSTDPTYAWREAGLNRYEVAAPQRAVITRDMQRQIEELPSYTQMLSAIVDGTDTDKLGKLLVSPGGSLVLDPRLISLVVWPEVRPWDPGRSRRLLDFCRLVDLEYFADHVEYSVIWPLPGLTTSIVPITLSDEVLIDKMSSDEVVAALEQNILYPGEYASVELPNPLCLRYRTRIKKEFSDDFSGELPPSPPTDEILARFYRAWRLLTPDRLEHSGYLRNSRLGVPHFVYGQRRYVDVRPFPEVILSEDDQLQVLWQAVADQAVAERLGIALRRFADSVDRERFDDRIVDMLVAAEAIYLSEVDDRSELSYRFAIRAAAFSDLPDLVAAFRFFRAAYNIRSKVVHGTTLKKADMPLPSGTQAADPNAFADALEAAMRYGITKAVHRVMAGETVAANWEALILGSSELAPQKSATARTRRGADRPQT